MNRLIARFGVLMVISVFIAMTGGCVHETNHGMDGIVTSIRAEYAAVAPSLLQAARELIAQTEPLGVKFKGKPYIECHTSRKPPSGVDEFDPKAESETTFTVWAVECIISYGPPEIEQIDKQISLKVPLTATVHIPVTTSYRRSEKLKYIHKGSGRFPFYGFGHNLPLPVPLGQYSLPKGYPSEVYRLAAKAKAQCLKAKQAIDPTKMQVVHFEYDAAKATWVPKPRGTP